MECHGDLAGPRRRECPAPQGARCSTEPEDGQDSWKAAGVSLWNRAASGGGARDLSVLRGLLS